MMARNEEKFLSKSINCIREQIVKPTRIYVLNDGSTDGTAKVLTSMKDVTVTHGRPHPPQHSEDPLFERRLKTMYEAAARVWTMFFQWMQTRSCRRIT